MSNCYCHPGKAGGLPIWAKYYFWPVVAVNGAILALVAVRLWLHGVLNDSRLLKTESAPEEAQPDVTMKLVYPKNPALMLINKSEVLAKQIKWCVVLWNVDNPKAYSFGEHQEDDHEPLPIPVATFDYLRGGKSSVQNLFVSPSILPHIKEGDRLIGSASVDCPSCAGGHAFLIYIKYGTGGWYFEVISEKTGDIIIPAQLKRAAVLKYADEILSETLEANRIPILDS